MKQMLENLKQKIGTILEENVATKGRTTGFRITVAALLTTAIICITWFIIKTIP